ncbi:lytic transglycosylase domain-containing protein [Dactylosporangium sp. NBC_01737]|uniref:lytic transglycosylase domain-containing protein n=1 Tax=Dactylosporangium sp. NBC_01737 TaxID=2975959 RepID=UPI002E0FEEF2|nr:lytic transglycosylase domain-containing protein [Dactylosporangium sp. NBC_01737]
MSYGDFYDDDTAEQRWDDEEFRPRRRRVGMIFLIGALVVVSLIAVGGLTVLVKGRDRVPVSAGSSQSSSPAEPSAEPTEVALEVTSAPPSPTPSATPSKTPAAKKSIAPPKQTALPPPPPKVSTKPGCQPEYKGTQLPKSTVRGYLDAASTKQFWGSATPAEVQAIRVPKRLLYGVADQESGWQSNIYACDGGVGVMQIMPDTETWMNQRFGTSWKIGTPQDNVMLGGQYLAWAIRYFGEQLGTFDVMGADPTLLNAVISAYNNGAGAVDLTKGDAGITNWSYVNNVRALMTRCCADY